MRSPGLLILVLAVACGSDRPGPGTLDAPGPPGDALQIMCPSGGPTMSFQTDIVPLIGHCGGEGCHGGIRLMTWPYQTLTNVVAADCPDQRLIVKPGDPAASYLVQKLAGIDMCSGVRMPKLGTPLPDADMAKIEAWICQGAPDN